METISGGNNRRSAGYRYSAGNSGWHTPALQSCVVNGVVTIMLIELLDFSFSSCQEDQVTGVDGEDDTASGTECGIIRCLFERGRVHDLVGVAMGGFGCCHALVDGYPWRLLHHCLKSHASRR